MPLPAGVRVGPYEIVAPIGHGGMGEVYRARDTRLDRTVAIKVLTQSLATETEFRRRFEREARAIAALNHPHICALHDVGPDYLVMEYIEGVPLRGPMPVREALRLAVQITDALDAAHRHGITHRDLKPGNILVTKAGVKLLDFGLAKRTAGEVAVGSATDAPTVSSEQAKQLFQDKDRFRTRSLRYDVTPDGQLFLFPEAVEEPRPAIRVIQNWFSGFRQGRQSSGRDN